MLRSCCTNTKTMRSFDSLRLDFDGLAIDKDSLSLVWFRFSPLPNACSKLFDHDFICSFKQYSSRLRGAGGDSFGNSKLDGIRIAQFYYNKFLTRIFWLLIRSCGINRRSISNTVQSQNGSVTFRDTEYMIVQCSSSSACACQTSSYELKTYTDPTSLAAFVPSCLGPLILPSLFLYHLRSSCSSECLSTKFLE